MAMVNRRLGLLVWAGFCAACGARTELARGGSDASTDASSTCAAQPWLLFDYSDGTAGTFSIYAMHPDGSSFHPLDLDGARGIWPTVSPDGTKLLYLKIVVNSVTLVLRDLATHAEHALATGLNLTKAAMSPNNQLIAYGNVPDLHMVSADGTGDHVLVQGGGPVYADYPVFSLNSSTVYFNKAGSLESIRTDGTSLQVLSQSTTGEGMELGPSLSPDGTKLVAPVDCGAFELRVFSVTSLPGDLCMTGTKLAEITSANVGADSAAPSWGPDSVIVYHDGRDLLLVDAAGGAPTNITSQLTTSGWAGNPVWAPGCAGL